MTSFPMILGTGTCMWYRLSGHVHIVYPDPYNHARIIGQSLITESIIIIMYTDFTKSSILLQQLKRAIKGQFPHPYFAET